MNNSYDQLLNVKQKNKMMLNFAIKFFLDDIKIFFVQFFNKINE